MPRLYSTGRIVGGNVCIVPRCDTIQSVIDSITDSSVDNPYVVMVPPGHEKEFYSLVRNAADVASDKRNVKVIFENNPTGEFQFDQFDACDVTTNWVGRSASVLTLDSDHNFEGSNCFKITESTTGNMGIQKTVAALFDIRGYQEVVMDVAFDTAEIKEIQMLMYDEGNAHFNFSRINYTNMGYIRTTVSFPLFFSGTSNAFDYSKVHLFRLTFSRRSGYTGTCTAYVDNIRFMKTTPYNTAILRFDDSTDEHATIARKLLDNKGWKGTFLVTQPTGWGSASKLSMEQIKSMDRAGHDIINHTIEHPVFTSIGVADTWYNVNGMTSVLEYMGITKTQTIFGNPSGSSNEYLRELLIQSGTTSVYPGYNLFPASIMGLSDPNFTIPTGLQRIVDRNVGGIVQLMFHTITNETNFLNRLDWIAENFSEIIVATDVIDRFPNAYKSTINQQKDYGFEDILTDNFRLYFFHGSNILLDPNGVNRKVTPVQSSPNGGLFNFRPFHKIEIINTADAAETLTFDQTFNAAGVHDGANNVDILTDSGESWFVGQLIGRTINNTTDGSSGTVMNNSPTTITATLSGGTDNDWDIGDTYTITPTGLNQAIAQNERGIFTYNGSGWVKIFVG